MEIGITVEDYKVNILKEYLRLLDAILKERPEGKVRVPILLDNELIVLLADIKPPLKPIKNVLSYLHESGSITVEKVGGVRVTFRNDPRNGILIKEIFSNDLNIGVSIEITGNDLKSYRVLNEWYLLKDELSLA